MVYPRLLPLNDRLYKWLLMHIGVTKKVTSSGYEGELMVVDLLFKGYMWLIPLTLGVILLLFLVRDVVWAKRSGATWADRLKRLRLLRSLIPALPLAGIIGTVWGLMETLEFMGSTNVKDNMNDVISKFATALNTTFWGVTLAVLMMVFYEIQISRLESREEDG